MAGGTSKLQSGYPDYVGKRFIWTVQYTGPASYVTGGDPFALPRYDNFIDNVFDATDTTGTYQIRGIASGLGPRATWKFKIYVISTGAEVGAATNLSTILFNVSGFGGVY